MLRLQHKQTFQSEAHYVPFAGDSACHLMGMRIFPDAYQQLFHPPVDHLRGDFAGCAFGAR
jgi:hypothetical protein